MNLKFRYFSSISLFVILTLVSCNKTTPTSSNADTTLPEIVSIVSDKSQIHSIEEFTDITCTAKGGNLSYKWEVDLGDLIPQNTNHSVVRFSGAACCEGEKEIKCTVSNDKGSITKTVIVKIIPEVRIPDINSLTTSSSVIHSSIGEFAEITCFAVGGGNMKYQWTADCGEFVYSSKDSSVVKYYATEKCNGNRILSCKVSNEKGEITKYITLLVTK